MNSWTEKVSNKFRARLSLVLVVQEHLKEALCFMRLLSLYCAVYFLIVQFVLLWVLCSQNMQHLGHDRPLAREPPVKPQFRFDLPYLVSHQVALLVFIPDPSLPYLCLAVEHPGP